MSGHKDAPRVGECTTELEKSKSLDTTCPALHSHIRPWGPFWNYLFLVLETDVRWLYMRHKRLGQRSNGDESQHTMANLIPNMGAFL